MESAQTTAKQARSSLLILVLCCLQSLWTDGRDATAEPVFVNVYGAQESIPRKRFRQPMYSSMVKSGRKVAFHLTYTNSWLRVRVLPSQQQGGHTLAFLSTSVRT